MKLMDGWLVTAVHIKFLNQGHCRAAYSHRQLSEPLGEGVLEAHCKTPCTHRVSEDYFTITKKLVEPHHTFQKASSAFAIECLLLIFQALLSLHRNFDGPPLHNRVFCWNSLNLFTDSQFIVRFLAVGIQCDKIFGLSHYCKGFSHTLPVILFTS